MRTALLISTLFLAFIGFVLLTGCTNTAAPTPVAATPTQQVVYVTVLVTPTAIPTPTPRPTHCTEPAPGVMECLYTDITTTTTGAKSVTTVPTPEVISSPLAAPITFTGVGGKIVWFEAAAPGPVTFKMRNGFGSQHIENCDAPQFSVSIAGKSTDAEVYKGGAYTGATKTYTIPEAGRYSLTIKGCEQWEISLS